MKLQAIRKACMDRDTFYILDRPDGRQWISNGAAAWPVEGIEIEEGSVGALFDIPEKKQGLVSITRREYADGRFQAEPMEDYEMELKDLGDILYRGNVYKALKNDEGVMLIDIRWLKPVQAGNGYRYCERYAQGREPLVAVYGDLLAGALIMPMTGKNARKILEDAWNILREKIRGDQEQPEEETGEQLSMEEENEH